MTLKPGPSFRSDPLGRTEVEYWIDHEIARLTGIVVDKMSWKQNYRFLNACKMRGDRFEKLEHVRAWCFALHLDKFGRPRTHPHPMDKLLDPDSNNFGHPAHALLVTKHTAFQLSDMNHEEV